MVEVGPSPSLLQRRGIIGLDLLRFSAAVLVVVYHLGHRAWAPPIDKAGIRRLIPDAPAFPEWEAVAWLGWVGVEIFFIISGFVIASSAEGSSPFRFLRSRILRLTPAIWICASLTLVALVVVRGWDPYSFVQWARTVALPLFPKAPWVDSVYWTLILEFVFYGGVFLLLLFNRFSHIGAAALALGWMSSLAWFAHAAFGAGDWFLSTWTAQVLLVRHGCFFAAGVVLWLVLFKRATAWRVLSLIAFMAAGVLEVGQLADAKAEVIGRALPVSSVQLLFLAGVAAIIASVLFDKVLKRLVGRSAAIFPILGLMTYPLYLVHNVVGVTLMDRLEDAGLQRHLAFGIAAAFVIALAFCISRWAEPAIAEALRRPLEFIGRGERVARLSWLFKPTRPIEASAGVVRGR